MKKALVVVDMQNDFVDGVLGTKEAVAIIPAIKDKITKLRSDGYEIIFTRDTHPENYLETQEGEKLPVPHCIKNTNGWEICPQLKELIEESDVIINKETFGSTQLGELLEGYDIVELCGVCTDICVVSNAILVKAYSPETEIYIDEKCVAGVTPESNDRALEAMKVLQINII